MPDQYLNLYECETCGAEFKHLGEYEEEMHCEDCDAHRPVKPYDSQHVGVTEDEK